jgi:adenylate kinase family enzyme
VKRVAVIGSGGAGKSTFARDLGRLTDLPVIHLDHLFWRPGWEATADEEWQARHAELIRRERWIIDGNYGSTMASRLAAADTVIFLDLPRLICLWRVLRRRLLAGRFGRPNQIPGLPDQLDREFLAWIWNYPVTKRPAVLDRLARVPSTTTVHRLRSPGEARAFLEHLPIDRAAA